MGLIDAGFMGKCHARAQEQPNQLHWTPLNAPTQTPERGGHGLSAAAGRASRVTIGHPEGMPLAFANIYADFAEAIRADRAGRARSAGAGLSERRGRAPLLAGRPCRGGVGPRTGGVGRRVTARSAVEPLFGPPEPVEGRPTKTKRPRLPATLQWAAARGRGRRR